MKIAHNFLRRNRPGQMLLEVIIAMGILILFATAFMTLALTAYEGRGRAEDRIVATYAAWEGLEAARSLGWDSFDALQDSTYGFDENGALVNGFKGTIQDRFLQEITVSSEDDAVHQTKHVESTVSWALSEGKHAQVTLEAFLTSWRRPRWLTDLASDFEQGGINAMSIVKDDDGGVMLNTNGNFLQPEVFAQIPVTSRIRDLHIDPVSDFLYVLTDENPLGSELFIYDISNVSSGSGTLTLVAEQELIKDGIAFTFGEKYAYILTGHSDQEVVVLRLSDHTIVNAWDIEADAAPRDIAIDEKSGRAYVTLSTAEERFPEVIAHRENGAKPVRQYVRVWHQLSDGILWVLSHLPSVGTVFAQGAPACNGSTATIYVSGGFIVGGPDNGNAYTAGVTTLRGNNTSGSTDVIVGTSGNDIIQGQAGIDVICGGAGNDTIDGGNQNDVIFGEDGNDTIDAGSNNDTICGGAGTDDLSGGNGTDSIAGGADTDTVNGNGGTDICREGETNSNCEDFASAIATCGVTSDTTNPTVSTLSPTDNATGVALGANLVITFSEAVNAVSGNITIKKTSDNSTIQTIGVTSGQVTGGGTTTITINPSSDLAESMSFYVLIDTTAFDDLAGNSYAGINSTTAWNFTTATCTPSPLPTCNGQTATVYVNDCNVIVGGNDNGGTYASTLNGSSSNDVMVGTSGADTINGLTGDDTICGLGGSDIVGGDNGNDTIFGGDGNDTLSGNNNDDILCGQADTDSVNGNAGTDQLAGGAGTDTLNGGSGSADICREGESNSNCEDTSSAIATCGVGGADITDPTVSTLSPTDDATGVSPTANLVITFSEAVNAVSGNITIKKTSDNSTVETIGVTSGLVTGGGTTTITINPTTTLAGLVSYYVLIDATAFDDLAGNSYAGISSSTAWNFTTASTDTTAPTISTLLPVDDATGVSTTTTLVITFSETVRAGTGTLTIKKTSDNATVETITVSGALLSGNGSTQLTLDPATTLAGLTSYYVVWTANAFKDTSGNHAAAQTSTIAWNFTTASTDTTAPTVSTLSPTDDATGISFSPTLQITFSEAVTAVSGNVTIKKSSDSSTIEAISVTSGQLSGSGTATITLSTTVTLSSLTAYYVQIDSTAFDDLSGNSYAGISETTTWNFTTASSDTTNPSISTLSPVDDATEVGNTTDLVITFDESVNVETGNITVKKASDASTVETIDVTSAQVTGDGTSTITVNITDLELATAYYVNIDATAFDDLVGNSFAGISNETTWNFTTAEEEVEVIPVQKTRAERIREVASKVYVFDIANPEATDSAAQVTQVNMGNFGEQIEVFGGFVFLAVNDTDAELRIMNTETLAVERCDLPGKQLVKDMDVRGNRLYVARTEGEEEEFSVYDIDENNPGDCERLLESKVQGLQLADDARSLTMLPQEDVAFVLGNFIESALQIIDLATEKRSGWFSALLTPLAIAQNTPVSFLQGFNGICDSIETAGSYLYAGCRTEDDKTVLAIIGGERGSRERFQRGTFTAPPFDSGSNGTLWKRIAWRQNAESPTRLRIRVAATKEGLQQASWVGANGLISTPFVTNAGESIAIPNGTSGTRWIQWKAYFEDSESVPAIEDVILTFDQPS